MAGLWNAAKCLVQLSPNFGYLRMNFSPIVVTIQSIAHLSTVKMTKPIISTKMFSPVVSPVRHTSFFNKRQSNITFTIMSVEWLKNVFFII
jgi:hypothetical protein